MKKQSIKQPLKETLMRIGGAHLLKEQSKGMIMNYSDHLGAYLEQLRPNIRGWKFGVERMTGSWEWTNRKFEPSVFATWGWEGKNEIPLETSDGDAFKAVKLKLKASEPEDEQNLKRDAKKYIDTMKKEIPKIEKKLCFLYWYRG